LRDNLQDQTISEGANNFTYRSDYEVRVDKSFDQEIPQAIHDEKVAPVRFVLSVDEQ
jgi:hypothetical protein